jgi:ribosome maturation factor RimP
MNRDLDPVREVEEIIAPSLQAMGYEVVRVRLMGGQRRPTLQVMAERADRKPMAVDDCAEISHTVSALLDVADPLAGSYVLEVSSPGIDRPLTRPEHFERYAGFEARIETAHPIDGRRRFRGRLLGVDNETVRLALPEGEIAIPFAEIGQAKLVLSDELIAATREEG